MESQFTLTPSRAALIVVLTAQVKRFSWRLSAVKSAINDFRRFGFSFRKIFHKTQARVRTWGAASCFDEGACAFMLDDLHAFDDLNGSDALPGERAQSSKTLQGFCPGTIVQTAFGDTSIEQLRAGDMVWTRHNGLQPIQDIEYATVTGTAESRPVCIASGCLNACRDVHCAPNQEVLIEGSLLEMYLGARAARAAVATLVNGDSINSSSKPFVHYIALRFKRPEIIIADGLFAVSRGLDGQHTLTNRSGQTVPDLSYEDGLVMGSML